MEHESGVGGRARVLTHTAMEDKRLSAAGWRQTLAAVNPSEIRYSHTAMADVLDTR